MKQQDPEAAGWTRKGLVASRGECRVYATNGDRELWCLPVRLASAAESLLELGALGIGGFEAGGSRADRLWLVRSPATPTVKQFWSENKPSWQVALAIAAEVADSLAVCEERGMWPGPLHPSNIAMHATRPSLRADELVSALLGVEAPTHSPGSVLGRYTPPAQANGEPWDAAANRFVLGLIVYRMLAGEHALAGQGLRLGLERLATRGAAPFSEALARTLPAGLQAYCLSLLAPASQRRPPHAAAIASALRHFVDAPGVPFIDPGQTPGEPPPRNSGPVSTARQGAPNPRSGRTSWLVRASLVVPLLSVISLITLVVAAPGASEAPRVRERQPLVSARLSSTDCESCHPRQTAEWRRSVMAHSVKSPLFLALEANRSAGVSTVLTARASCARRCPGVSAGIRKPASS